MRSLLWCVVILSVLLMIMGMVTMTTKMTTFVVDDVFMPMQVVVEFVVNVIGYEEEEEGPTNRPN